MKKRGRRMLEVAEEQKGVLSDSRRHVGPSGVTGFKGHLTSL